MRLTVEYFINSTKNELQMWEKGVQEINQGTFKYDSSLPKSCTIALYKHKVVICKEVLDYLNTLDKDLVIQTNVGTTEEGSKYYELINK